MATQQESLDALNAGLKASAERGVSGYREGDDSATYHDIDKYAKAMQILADETLVSALSGTTPRDRFVFTDYG